MELKRVAEIVKEIVPEGKLAEVRRAWASRAFFSVQTIDYDLPSCPATALAVACGIRPAGEFSVSVDALGRARGRLSALCSQLGVRYMVAPSLVRPAKSLADRVARASLAARIIVLFPLLALAGAVYYARWRGRAGIYAGRRLLWMLQLAPPGQLREVAGELLFTVREAAGVQGGIPIPKMDVLVARDERTLGELSRLLGKLRRARPSAAPGVDRALGAALGYPRCCIEDYVGRKAGHGRGERVHPTEWLVQRVAALPYPPGRPPSVVQRCTWHRPCCEGCPATGDIAARMANVLRKCYGIDAGAR